MYLNSAERRNEARSSLADSTEHASLRLLRAVSSNREQSRDICREMRALADSFRHIGNDKAAAQLFSWSDEIEDLATLVWNEHAENQMAELRTIEEHTGSMMRLAIGLVSAVKVD